MPRPQIPLETIRHIEELWAMNPSQSAVQIRIKYLQYSNAHQIGNRKVQMIIANARQVNQRYMAFHSHTWKPWTCSNESSEDSNYLLEINATSLHAYGRGLYQHEAFWAKRLRASLTGLSKRAQCLMIFAYGTREQIANRLDYRSIYTSDLDNILATKPWQHPILREEDADTKDLDPHLYPEIPEQFVWTYFLENPSVNLPRILEIFGLPKDWDIHTLLAVYATPPS